MGALKRKPPKCWNCEEVGHIQRFCPKRKFQHRAKVIEDEVKSESDGEVESGPESSDGEGAFPASRSAEVPNDRWLVDSGASSHMTPKREYFSEYKVFSTPEKVALGDGRVVEAVGVGTVRLTMLFKVSNSKNAVMYDVLHVPKLSCNLFSVRAAAKRGNTVKFCQSRCWIRGPKGSLQGMGLLSGKLYQLKCEVRADEETASLASENPSEALASAVGPSKQTATQHSRGSRTGIRCQAVLLRRVCRRKDATKTLQICITLTVQMETGAHIQ